MRLVAKAAAGWLAAIVAVSAALLGATPPGAAADLAPVRFGTQVATSNAGLYIAQELGYFKEEGVDLQLVVMTDPPALIAALATGQLDAGGISVTPGLFSAIEQGINLKVVGDKQSLGNGFAGVRLAVRKGFAKATPNETFEALRGKKVALNTKGAITFYLLKEELARHKLGLNDVQVVELSQPNMVAALGSGAIDAALLLEPFLSQAIHSGIVTELSDLTKAVPGGSAVVTPIVYGEKFSKNRKVAEAFMRGYMRGVRAYNDAFRKGVDKDKVIKIIADQTKNSVDVIAKSFPPGLDPNQRVTLTAFEAYQSFYAEQGLVRKPIDVKLLIDPSFAEAAVKALGEYK